MTYAVKVTPLDNYNIIVEFNTGEIKIYNCYPLFSIPLFAKLKDKDFFMTAHIDETGLVCWDNSTDIPPDELYNNSVDICDDDTWRKHRKWRKRRKRPPWK